MIITGKVEQVLFDTNGVAHKFTNNVSLVIDYSQDAVDWVPVVTWVTVSVIGVFIFLLVVNIYRRILASQVGRMR